MVDRDIAGRGVRSARLLEAMRAVPRHRFLPPELAEFAYDDTPLPIAEGQTISQPYIVAAMTEALDLSPGDRVLEIGTGSGYAAAVLGEMADEVWSIERHQPLADSARTLLEELNYDGVHVVCGDGTLGWPERAPYDAIIVAAGGPSVPPSLLEQLADGGRLVIPVGPETRGQELIRVRRQGDEFDERNLGAVRFVPLVGEEGWKGNPGDDAVPPASSTERPGRSRLVLTPGEQVQHPQVHGLPALVAETAEPFGSIEDADLGGLLERIGDSPVVLLGEASHGTSEFYRMRDRITRELVLHKGFVAVAVEADWPDAARVDAYIRGREPSHGDGEPFSRFPTWMWRNREVLSLVNWLADHNSTLEDPARQVSFHGLDLYSLFTSRDAVLAYLDKVDPDAAAVARRRYGCLTPWENDPASYGRAVISGGFEGCEDDVVAALTDLLRQRVAYAADDDSAFVEATQNAMVVANAEKYYRAMYHGSRESWNLRDLHMFETLKLVRAHRGPGAKVVVWEHNSHVGDASATEMGARGEHNVGMLTRREYGDDAFIVGFGTDHGVVAAASDWGGPMERKDVRPSHPQSYERVCHDSGVPAFLLHLRDPRRQALRDELTPPRLERAIGVIYRPETELQSHYFQATLPGQFDEYIWFDKTSAVTPIEAHDVHGMPDTYPFGL